MKPTLAAWPLPAPRRTEQSLARRGALLHTAPALIQYGLAYAPTGLVPWPARYRMSQIELSPRCFSFGAFECRLDNDERVDFLACVGLADGGDLALRGDAVQPPASEMNDDPSLEILHRWAESSRRLRRGVTAVWLEYDLPATGHLRPIPFVFLRLAANRRVMLGRKLIMPVVVGYVELCRAYALPSSHGRLIERCEGALPASGQILHVAVMPQRDVEILRLHFGLPRGELCDYLLRIGWTGDCREVRRLLKAWRDAPEVIGVQLDLGRDVRPNIDLEFYLNTSPAQDQRWSHFLRALRRWGLCREEKLHMATRWPSMDGSPTLLDQWPARVIRDLQIKLRLNGDGSISTKAYLGFTPRFSLGDLTASLAKSPVRKVATIHAARRSPGRAARW